MWRAFQRPPSSFAQEQLSLLEAGLDANDGSRERDEFPSPYFSQPLSVPKGAYYPNPRAEKVIQSYLADHASEIFGKTALDVGTGAGVLALALAQHGAKRVVATDITPESVLATKKNAERFQFASIETLLVKDPNFVYKELPPQLKFEIIVSNPPFQRVFLGPEKSLAFFRELIGGVSDRLMDGGVALFYISDVVAHHNAVKIARSTPLHVAAHPPYLISYGDLEWLLEPESSKDTKKSVQRRDKEKYFLVPRHVSLAYQTKYPGLIVLRKN